MIADYTNTENSDRTPASRPIEKQQQQLKQLRHPYHHYYHYQSLCFYSTGNNSIQIFVVVVLVLVLVVVVVGGLPVAESFQVSVVTTQSTTTTSSSTGSSSRTCSTGFTTTESASFSPFMNRRFLNQFQRLSSSIYHHQQHQNNHIHPKSYRFDSRKYMSTTSNNGIDPLHTPPTHVCIVGGGIIGTSTAYYLATQYGIRCTIIDRTGTIASAASGKAGGFLAYNWNDGTFTESLTHRSFQLHEELANKFIPESIQYRKLSCVAMNIASLSSSSSSKPTGRKLQNIEWASTDVIQSVRTLGNESTIAQVHPKLLCERLWYETKQSVPSCQLIQGNVIETVITTTTTTTTNNIDYNNTINKVNGVKLGDGTMIDADAVMYSCGPWNLFHPQTTGDLHTSMQGIKYHSLIVPTPRIYTQCVFFHGYGDPEVYVRPDQTAYCTGYPESARIVTEKPGEEEIDDTKISLIYTAIQQVSTRTLTTTTMNTMDKESNDDTRPSLLLENKDKFIQQACYLPTTDDGIPIMGKLYRPLYKNHHPQNHDVQTNGLYVATGHSCWGILLGPATGECMASLIATGQSTKYVDLDAFDPYRFMA